MFKWPDQSVYKGMWKDGMQDGKGKYSRKDKDTVEAIWEKGKLVTKSKGKGKQKKGKEDIERDDDDDNLQSLVSSNMSD